LTAWPALTARTDREEPPLRNPFAKTLRRQWRALSRRSLRTAQRALRQVLVAPAKAKARTKPKTTSRSAAKPRAARLLTRSFTGAAGARDYRLQLPKAGRGRPRGLLVMLHGCGQDAVGFAAATRMNQQAGAAGLLVAWPQQTRQANGQGCWNWFRPSHQRRDLGEPGILAGITRQLVVEFKLPPTQVFVAGLSAGGAMALLLAAEHPELFHAVGVHSGLLPWAARDAASALRAMRGGAALPATATLPIGQRCILFHGTADPVVAPANAAQLLAALMPAAAAQQRSSGSAGGRRYERIQVRDATDKPQLEAWLVEGAGHAWSGGAKGGSFSDPQGPDATAEMLRFFLQGSR